MSDYDFDIPFKVYQGSGSYHWEVNINGDRSYESVPGSQLWGLGFAGMLAGMFFLAFAYFFPFEMNYRIAIAIGGFVFCIGGFVAGWLIEWFIRSKGPILILKPDKTIVLHRLGQTIIPDSTTHFELFRPKNIPRKLPRNAYDLILWHQNQTYYVTSGLKSIFNREPNTPLEKLHAELCEIYSFDGVELKSQKEVHDLAIERRRMRNQNGVLFVLFMLGSTFTLSGGWLLWKHFGSESQSGLGANVHGFVFFGVGIIISTVFLYLLMRSFGHKDNH